MRQLLYFVLVLLLVLPAFGEYVAQDPTRYIPNARVLGLGKAYMGMADDTGSLYTNPAGLAEASNWELTSMSGKFLDEYSYLSFSGFYPTEYGTIGLGFARTSIAGAYPTTIEAGSDPYDPIYTIDTSQDQMGNYNNAFILSYANKLGQLPGLGQLPLANNMLIGANVKIFDVSLYGDHITGGNGSGQEFDLGVKLRPPQQNWINLGATIQNLLPTSMGGVLKYQSGHQESYPSVVEMGGAFTLLGKENALYLLGDQSLKLAIDADYHPTLKSYPLIMHAGVEWQPIPLIALRAGLDQDTAGDGAGGLTTVTDMAYGLGLYWAGFRFDYAYHTFAGAPNVDNSYFSFSYGLLPKKVTETAAEPIVIDTPADNFATFEAKAKIEGRVLNPAVRALTINGMPLKYTLRGFFSTELDIKIGQNPVVLEGKTERGQKIAEKKINIVRLYSYPDVPGNYWVAEPISRLAMANLITGYPDGTFRPEGGITRAEMCTLLIKSLGEIGEPLPIRFNDVPPGHWASRSISTAAERGVVKGYPGNLFKPNGKITRAEGVAMVVRFTGISEEAYDRQFPDVFGRSWMAKIVSGAQKAGLLDFLKGKDFEPSKPLTRAETVEILYKTKYIQDLLKKTQSQVGND